MIFLQQTGAAVLLVLITLTIQCGGAAALIIWIRSIPRETRKVRVFRCAALVMQTTVAVIILHGIVILLWASCYRWLCLPSWESAFYFLSEQLCDRWIRGCGPSVEVAPVGPARKHGRHADGRSLHWTSIRGGHSSGRRRVTISSTTSRRAPRMRMRSVSDKGGVVICEAFGPMCRFPDAQLTVRTGLIA